MKNEKDLNHTLKEIKALAKKMNSHMLVKDILIILVPLVVALFTVYQSNNTFQQELEHNRNVERANIIANFADKILEGGKSAKIAQIAFEASLMPDSLWNKIADAIELIEGGADIASTDLGEHPLFKIALDQLFDSTKTIREKGYVRLLELLNEKKEPVLIESMMNRIRSDPFNIKGRSNVLSILTKQDPAFLLESKSYIRAELEWISGLENVSPGYAIGPQTKGWISQLNTILQ